MTLRWGLIIAGLLATVWVLFSCTPPPPAPTPGPTPTTIAATPPATRTPRPTSTLTSTPLPLPPTLAPAVAPPIATAGASPTATVRVIIEIITATPTTIAATSPTPTATARVVIVTATRLPPTPTLIPLATATTPPTPPPAATQTPFILVITATPTRTPTATPTRTATATPHPIVTLTGRGAALTAPVNLTRGQPVRIRITTATDGLAAFTLVYPGGCAVEILRTTQAYSGQTLYYVANGSQCADRVLPAGAVTVSITAASNIPWTLTFDQRPFSPAVNPPYTLSGSGDAIGAPVLLDQYNVSVLTWTGGRNDVALRYMNISTGAIVGHPVYAAPASTVMLPFTGVSGHWIPFVSSNSSASWTVTVNQ